MVQDVPKLQVFFDSGKVEVPAEFADKGKFIPTCSPKAQECITAIWTELQK